MTPHTNKAWVLPQFGADALRFDETARSKPGPEQVEIQVAAASLNYRDLLVVDGDYAPDAELPFVPASDAAGTVSAVGNPSRSFSRASESLPTITRLGRVVPCPAECSINMTHSAGRERAFCSASLPYRFLP